MRVLILGGGPVGRACAIALIRRGHATTVLEAGPPRVHPTSRDHGAQFLWEPLPEFETTPITVVTEVDGTWARPESIRKYKERVGRSVNDRTDQRQWAEQFEWTRTAHRIDAYPIVPTIYNLRVTKVSLTNFRVSTTQTEIPYDALVNTLPLPDFLAMCDAPFDDVVGIYRSNHEALGVWRTTDPQVLAKLQTLALRERRDRVVLDRVMENLVYVNYFGSSDTCFSRVTYNGTVADFEAVLPVNRGWCRVTGFNPSSDPTIKFPYGKIWDVGSFIHEAVVTYLKNNGVHLLGRYGAWDQEQLLHHSYQKADWLGSKL